MVTALSNAIATSGPRFGNVESRTLSTRFTRTVVQHRSERAKRWPARAWWRRIRREDRSGMEIVIVGGPHSGIGKKLAAERALQALAGQRYGAIKLTVADGEFDAPHNRGMCGRGASCGVCETVHVSLPSRVVTAPGAIGKSGTDTCRLRDAGAVAVAWVIA